MSTIVQGVRTLTGRSHDLPSRLDGLEQAADAAAGRLDEAVVGAARDLVDRAGERLRLSGEHTVVAIAGATGSGKSSLFNAITGLDLAAVGVRRPTTAWALAYSWGPDGADGLLDWLGIPQRHRVSRASALDTGTGDRDLQGLVLLDLPDHDSTEVAHHLEVERLVGLVDVFVWVLDPQKYADAAIHDRFLRPLASHADVMLVVLNHVDELGQAQRDSCLTDIRRLLKADGLGTVPVIATSATRGDGLAELRSALASRVAAKRAARDRLAADIDRVSSRFGAAVGAERPPDIARSSRASLVDTFADAAGVPVVVRAVESANKKRARQATGWPVTRWLSRFRPDPLRRLHLDGADRTAIRRQIRSSLPAPSPVQRARVDTDVRRLVDTANNDLPAPWANAVRRASVSRLDDLGDALDQAVTGTDLGAERTPLWWRAVGALQWVLFAIAVAGGLWLAALAGMSYLRLPQPGTPEWHGFPLPTLLLVGGVVAGILLALFARLAAGLAARRRARAVDRRLRSAISEVTERLVVDPIEAELAAYRRFRAGVTQAQRR